MTVRVPLLCRSCSSRRRKSNNQIINVDIIVHSPFSVGFECRRPSATTGDAIQKIMLIHTLASTNSSCAANTASAGVSYGIKKNIHLDLLLPPCIYQFREVPHVPLLELPVQTALPQPTLTLSCHDICEVKHICEPRFKNFGFA